MRNVFYPIIGLDCWISNKEIKFFKNEGKSELIQTVVGVINLYVIINCLITVILSEEIRKGEILNTYGKKYTSDISGLVIKAVRMYVARD